MAKHKQKKDRTRQSAADFRRNGLRAFQNGNYAAALQYWDRIPQTLTDVQLTAAKAEAHFRLGYAISSQPEQRQQHLQVAAALKPQEPRYQYHLGLAAYQAGDYPSALAALEKTRQTTALAPRVAFLLILTLLRLGRTVSDHPIWLQLPEEQKRLVQRAIPSLGTAKAERPTVEPPLWQGLVALQEERWSDAAAFLQKASHHADEAPLAHYGLGLVSAHQEKWAEAIQHWQMAHQGGYRSPNLVYNLGEVAHRLAEERIGAGDVTGAFAAAQQASQFSHDPALTELHSHLALHLGYQAAQQGNFDKAQHLWETVAQQEGSSFRLAYNLALIYEKNDDPIRAAEQWREVLRRRPRKADHPDALNEEQVSRLWQRAAAAYERVQDYDEAIHVYKNAVKYQPDNLALRLELVDSLFNNGQIEAAINETGRILSRDPNHIPTLLKAGEIHAQSGPGWLYNPATAYWEKVLTLDPNHNQARQNLVDFFLDQAEQHLYWLGPDGILSLLEKALQYQPDNGMVLAKIADVQMDKGDDAAAEATIQKVLHLSDLTFPVYEQVIQTLLFAGQYERMNDLIQKAEKVLTHPKYVFYMTLGMNFLEVPLVDMARSWFDKAIAVAPPKVPMVIMIGEAIVGMHNAATRPLAREYLQQALNHDELMGQARLMLGIAAAQDNDLKTARKEWQAARRQARHTHDDALSARLDRAEWMYGNNASFLGSGLAGMPPMPPGMLKMLANMLDEDSDEF